MMDLDAAPLSPINGPSDVSSEDDDSDAAPGPVAKRGRRFAANDPTYVRASLAKSCGCKNTCLAQFTTTDGLNSLLKFRNEMCEMHKLDQDRIDTQIEFSETFF